MSPHGRPLLSPASTRAGLPKPAASHFEGSELTSCYARLANVGCDVAKPMKRRANALGNDPPRGARLKSKYNISAREREHGEKSASANTYMMACWLLGRTVRTSQQPRLGRRINANA